MDSLALMVVIPFREEAHGMRARQRTELLTYLMPALERTAPSKGAVCRIYCATQSADGRRFNRGQLLNLGFAAGMRDAATASDVFARALSSRALVVLFHDVDLLPDEELVKAYWHHAAALARGDRVAVHFASTWSRYSDAHAYFGGVTMLRGVDFVEVGGFPGNAWGWGGEDDVLRVRVTRARLPIVRPNVGSLRDLEELTLAQKLATLHSSPSAMCEHRRELIAAASTVPPPLLSLCCKFALTRTSALEGGAVELLFTLSPACCPAHSAGADAYDTRWHAKS